MRMDKGLMFVVTMFCAGIQAQPAAEPQPSSGHYESVNGSRIYYEECGAGINLVLLHDGLLHSITWDDVWKPLCSKYHVIRYDRRGYGRSEAARNRFVPEEDLAALMRLVGMDRAILVGNSSGAGLALDFALAHPAMTEGLFLIGPVVHGMASSAYFLERGNRANAPLGNDDIKAVAENWSRDNYLIAGLNPAARKKLFDALAHNPQNFKTGGQFEIRPSPPTVLRLNRIMAPTVVVVGESDIADVTAYAGAIEAALPVAYFEVWKNCGHLIQLERPADLVARFHRFAVLADRREANVPSGTLPKYVGDYSFGERRITISMPDERLWLGLPDTPGKPLFAASSSRFFVRTTETEFEFQVDSSGAPVELVIHNADGATIRCRRI
jgi:3-oxoadipate enol-lactonase